MTILDTFTTRDGAIEIGGLPLSRLAERAGRTPFFAYDRSKLAERVALLRRWLAPDIRIHYSIKANPMPALVHCMAGLVDGFDVASAGELRVALDTGMAAEHIALAGPGKTELDVRSTVGAGATLTLESVHQLDAAARAGQALGVRPRVALRINPDFQPKTSGMRMGGGPRQFGIDAEQAPGVLAAIAQRDLDFRGFHVFWGSQCLDADTVISAQRHVAELVVRLADQAKAPVAFVNMGGGFGIPYFENERALDLEPIGAAMRQWLVPLRQRLPEARLAMEFGRYLVGEAGIYVCRILDKKVSRGETFLVTDGGLHHQLAASGNFGQVLRRNYPVAIGNKSGLPATETCHIVGCLCTPLDRIADRVALASPDIGDFVVVAQSGAYGRSASPAAFLSHPEPAEILV
ncbi:pyridoxal-dependent decarboxylase, exosortase A system-associated [Paracidovorax citrulli]|uniref:pyridoxal-dependent decarboxylase, exosortase A system-associated n=1 Tax=Paracidovorax citrulli TaxID=80869 RepID=UPI00031D88E2|nr:pyridoxal-dependent decarboxylase, exosortase A system-associated [Paracidovorax citrulli]QCX09762.1 L-glutamyl-[BtrI acyl-carrier protein] decarboxylase [Paracidovorax citrulli]UEG47240.1 pyridoxal-dependent decarboxylase, exosortase A system-associated [Paracidovorax citrulli]UMT89486.1 pyridoxal-dependent decarboxylase, exosortase A system-associated [Paracidovorax citrulli]UMT97540.1 pyridoxal-dependent decarboxylase, exosortase A system-associated [Paracidovorax citrulli]WIY35752.1 pyr